MAISGNGQTKLIAANMSPHELLAPEVRGTTGEGVLTFASQARALTVINDGQNDAIVALDGPSITEIDDRDLTHFTFTGASWAQYTFPNAYQTTHTQGGATDTSAAGQTADYNPLATVGRIGLLFVGATTGGIGDIYLSEDGGTTWATPSSIPGVTRSDGVTGTTMDTWDFYTTVSGHASSFQIVFGLPYESDQWRARVATSINKNGNSTAYYTFVDGGLHEVAGTAFKVAAGESIERNIKAMDVHFRAVVGAPTLRIWGEL